MSSFDGKEELVVLVDEHDHERGTMEKLAAHRTGELHRAFSVFIFNSEGALLLQQRAAGKYHSGGLWTNTCCSHPRLNETVAAAAQRRLKEEMGMSVPLASIFTFIYKADVGNGLIEHELDHVLFGHSDALPCPSALEVQAWRYVDIDALDQELKASPDRFTVWLRDCWSQVKASIPEQGSKLASSRR